MLSKGKQITLGIFTVIGLSVLATLALGEIGFIDTIDFAYEKPILLCAVYVLYFAVFIIYAALAKRKNLETLAKTTIILGAVLTFACVLVFIGAALDDYPGFDGSVLSKVLEVIVILFTPAISLVSLFIGIFDFDTVAGNLGMFVLFAAPIVAGIIYLFTKRPNKTEETEIQVPAEKE